ncbi:ferrous iron transport protein B, partial [Methanomethylovorans sp.]|uniref:ferrous iron transport protein B n=1 Tax=Methanomethylovorans sp. TaxID=2758717 RepID=UPI00351C286E
FIIDERPDVVVQVVDATNLERNLYLTTQLMELGPKLVIALNMSDMVLAKGDRVDDNKMEELLEVPVVRTVGSQEKGIPRLLEVIISTANKPKSYDLELTYGNEIENKIQQLQKELQNDKDLVAKYPSRWFSIKLLEGDENAPKKLATSSVVDAVQKKLDPMDLERLESQIADKRYRNIGTVVSQVCSFSKREMSNSEMIDRVVTHKFLSIPVFLTMLWAAFEITFSFSTPFMDIIDLGFGWLAGSVGSIITIPWLSSLIADGVIAGVGSVLIFLPNIMLLFFMLALLEDSGYMARAAFIMDKPMSKIGLNGKSFIPMLMGFGCNVPAIMATRTIEDKHDRLVTILIAPFSSCGARLPVYVLLAGAFFGKIAGSVIFALYALGILVAVLSAKLLRGTVVRGEASPFIMELPPYRLPTLKNSFMQMWERGAIYLRKAGGIILVGVVTVWLLAAIPAPGTDGTFASEDIYGTTDSLIGYLGKVLDPLVSPLGFDWRIAVALIFGFVAKEIVVGSMGTLYGAGEDEDRLSEILTAGAMSPLAALGLMVFTLLYVPCIACIGVIKRETGSWKWTLFQAVYGTGIAWLFAFIIFQAGSRIGFLT